MGRIVGAVAGSCLCSTAGARTVRHKAQVPRVLNNFVTELIRLEDVSRRGTHVVTFENGREGWILFRPTAWVGRKGRMTVTVVPAFQTELARSEKIVEYAPGDKKTVEIMR